MPVPPGPHLQCKNMLIMAHKVSIGFVLPLGQWTLLQLFAHDTGELCCSRLFLPAGKLIGYRKQDVFRSESNICGSRQGKRGVRFCSTFSETSSPSIVMTIDNSSQLFGFRHGWGRCQCSTATSIHAGQSSLITRFCYSTVELANGFPSYVV